MKVFESLAEALRQGYQVYDRVPAGYLVRTQIEGQWAFALVLLSGETDERDARPFASVRWR